MHSTKTLRIVLAAAASCIGLLASAPASHAAVASSLHADPACDIRDAADGEAAIDTELGYGFCDDGVPSLALAPGPGGLIPNATGASAITVPARYETAGNTHAGLPGKALDAASMAGADPTGNIAIDADISIPTSAPPAGGYPIVFMMHGCCGGNKTSWEAATIDAGGERWHYSNAWFASRGYVVVTYTARGFVDVNNRGSTGETQLNSRSFEVNDYQALACNVLAAAEEEDFDDVSGRADDPGVVDVQINPNKVVATGGSYGGGFSWLALTDPKWKCNADTGADTIDMSLAAVAAKYGWTDLAYTLVPNGMHSQDPGDLPAFDGCDTGPRDLDGDTCPGTPAPVGTPKTSIIGGLYLTGQFGADHTTFSPEIAEAFACLQGSYPLEDNPACANTLATILPRFLRERSAYYQNDFFAKFDGGMDDDPSYVTPIFNAATFTDPLFPPYENRRMTNRLLDAMASYPIQTYHGDYQHFVQNKAKEWGDLCGGDRHVCTFADYGSTLTGLNGPPAGLVATGVTTRLNRFLDAFAAPSANQAEPDPASDVTASLQVCPQNAGELGVAPNEPGPRFNAPDFEDLAPNTLTVDIAGAQTTTSKAAGNSHALNADPIGNSAANGSRCPVESSVAGAGVASYTSDALASGVTATMIGSTKVTADFSLTGSTAGLQLNARLYDVFPSGTAVMVDRGTRRITPAEVTAQEVAFELHGNGWRFQPGHRIRVELSQDDEPFVKSTSVPSSLALTNAMLQIPTVEPFGAPVGGGPDPKPTTPSGGSGTSTGGDTAAPPCKKKKKGNKKKKKKKKC